MSVALATYRRCWTTTRRAYPWTYFVGTVLQGVIIILIAYLMYHVVGGGTVSADFARTSRTADYVGYVAVGAIAYAFATRMILWVAKALIQEEREGTIAALLIAPAARTPYFAGFVLFSFVSSLAEVVALGLVAAGLGVVLPAVDLVSLLVAVAVYTFAIFALSLVLNAIMLLAGEAHITQNTCFFVMAVLCGFTFPTGYLPVAAQWLAEVFPLTSAMDVLRPVLAGADLNGSPGRLVTCLAVSAAYAFVGFRLLPYAERRVLERTL